MVELWAVRWERDLTDRESESLTRLLPPERRERLSKAPPAEVLCAYGLLRLALRVRCGWTDLPRIERSAHGKPFFPDCPEVRFSLSHTLGAALAGLADGPIGVDIQRIRPLRSSAMERICGVSSPDAFFPAWVRRESRSKRTGLGISSMLRQEPPLEDGERYCALDLFPGYDAGVSFGGGEAPGPVRICTLEELLEGIGAEGVEKGEKYPALPS